MDSNKSTWQSLIDSYHSAENFLADTPIAKAIGGVISNPTPQEVGAQVVNLGKDISKGIQQFTDTAMTDPAAAGSLVSPIAGTIVGKGIKGLTTIEDIAKAEIESRPTRIPTIEPKKLNYMSGHMAPTPEGNAPGYDVSQGIYPKDIYSSHGVEYYGDGQPYDWESMSTIHRIKNKPNAPVKIYRAVGKDVGNKINPGDWVTINRKYAVDHGEANLGGKGNYKIISKTVTAKDIYTDGNSIHEWGYAPQKGIEGEIPFKYMGVRDQINLAGYLAQEYINPNIKTRYKVPFTDEKYGKFGFPPPEMVNPEVEKIREALITAEEFLDKD